MHLTEFSLFVLSTALATFTDLSAAATNDCYGKKYLKRRHQFGRGTRNQTFSQKKRCLPYELLDKDNYNIIVTFSDQEGIESSRVVLQPEGTDISSTTSGTEFRPRIARKKYWKRFAAPVEPSSADAVVEPQVTVNNSEDVLTSTVPLCSSNPLKKEKTQEYSGVETPASAARRLLKSLEVELFSRYGSKEELPRITGENQAERFAVPVEPVPSLPTIRAPNPASQGILPDTAGPISVPSSIDFGLGALNQVQVQVPAPQDETVNERFLDDQLLSEFDFADMFLFAAEYKERSK